MNTEDNNDFYDDELSRSLISNDFEDDTPHRKKKSKKLARPVSLLLTMILAVGVMVLVMFGVIPQLTRCSAINR